MKKTRLNFAKFCVVLSSVGFLGGCVAVVPYKDVNLITDVGTEVYPKNYKSLVTTYLSDNLYDYDSLKQLEISPPQATICEYGYQYGQNGSKRGYARRYFSYVTYNAKNQYGGYTGRTSYIYWYILEGTGIRVVKDWINESSNVKIVNTLDEAVANDVRCR